MKTVRVSYLGNLRSQSTHIHSSEELITDAPVDNNGKGEAFSPTDLVTTATITCMLTTMGIVAEKNSIQMGDVEGDIEKIMGIGPRRIIALNTELIFRNHNLNESDKTLLENAALNCPVVKSIHPDIVINVKFNYD